MDQAFFVSIGRDTLFTALKIVCPALLVGMGVGLMISLFQAVTSIQEQTMTLVPKMIAVALTLMILMPWILTTLVNFANRMIMAMQTVVT